MNGDLTIPLASALVVIVALGLAVACVVWFHRRAAALLQRWADENGLQITASEQRILNRGPFFWTSGRGQVVFYVTVMDVYGQTRRGYVRCGSFWGGLLSDKVEVRWDESTES